MPKDGYFFDSIIRQKPLDPDNLNPEDNTEQYKPLTDAELDGIEEDARAVNTGEYAVFASLVNTALGDIAFVPGPDLTDPKGVRDVAEWYMLTASRPDVVHKIFERQVEVGIANLARIHARVGDAIDVLFLCGTDFGTQTSSFCSTKTFDLLWKPHYAAICDWVHKNTTWKTFKHSCGASERFFELMIDAGIDIINPVQCSAKGMDPKALKAKYKAGSFSGAAALTRSRPCRLARRQRCARRFWSAAKSSPTAAASCSIRSTTSRPRRRSPTWSRCSMR